VGEQHGSPKGSNLAVKVAVGGAILVAAVGIGLVMMQGGNDDRPPIIVRNGSLIFDGGEPTHPEKWKEWSKDAFLGEWKPKHDDGNPVQRFQVTFEGLTSTSSCSSTTVLTGEDVRIEYSNPTGTETTRIRLRIRKKDVFGKPEPKIAPGSVTLTSAPASGSTPPTLTYADNAQGWISKVTVSGTECSFNQPTSEAARTAFRVRIVPVP
jgi:hypothetical protein